MLMMTMAMLMVVMKIVMMMVMMITDLGITPPPCADPFRRTAGFSQAA